MRYYMNELTNRNDVSLFAYDSRTEILTLYVLRDGFLNYPKLGDKQVKYHTIQTTCFLLIRSFNVFLLKDRIAPLVPGLIICIHVVQ